MLCFVPQELSCQRHFKYFTKTIRIYVENKPNTGKSSKRRCCTCFTQSNRKIFQFLKGKLHGYLHGSSFLLTEGNGE